VSQPVVISCFDLTTTFVQPWADAGCLCYCVDMQHPPGETRTGNIVRVGADMLDWLPPVPSRQIVFAAFWPPCTDVAVSGARWFKDKGLGKITRALGLFKRSVDMAELIGCPYIIENPVSTVSKYWRSPDHTFDPCDYGDPYTKKTCLWTGGGFIMPPKDRVDPWLGSMMHKLPPSVDRANLRSATPPGFTKAVFSANAAALPAPHFS
jgi:hypothetical protein